MPGEQSKHLPEPGSFLEGGSVGKKQLMSTSNSLFKAPSRKGHFIHHPSWPSRSCPQMEGSLAMHFTQVAGSYALRVQTLHFACNMPRVLCS